MKQHLAHMLKERVTTYGDRTVFKYRDKLENLINDMHNKAAIFLLSKYRKIIIGKVSTKKMVLDKSQVGLSGLSQILCGC